MMDYDDLIKFLQQRATHKKPYIAPGETWTGGMVKDELCADAATAIETLCAELARVTAERDAAIGCLKNNCPFCKKYLTCQGRAINNDCWEFFGAKED